MTTATESARASDPFAMPLVEAMTTQRAIRRLMPDPVEDALVLRLIELALRAPTGGDTQGWQFVVVKDRAVKERLGRLNRMVLQLFGRRTRLPARDDPKKLRVLDAVQWQADHFGEIPVLVVACLRGVIPWFPRVIVSSRYGSIFPAVQNLLLAARAAGLGATLLTVPLWSTWRARRALGLPWNVTPCAIVPLGWPRGRYGPTTRRPVGDVVHVDRWGNQPFGRRGQQSAAAPTARSLTESSPTERLASAIGPALSVTEGRQP